VLNVIWEIFPNLNTRTNNFEGKPLIFIKASENQTSLSSIGNPRRNSLPPFLVVTILISLTLGFGVYPLVIPALMVAVLVGAWVGLRPYIHNLQKMTLEPGYLVLLILIGLFFACYGGFYIPYRPDILTMPWLYFWILTILSLLIVFWIVFLFKNADLITFIWSFCLGSLLFCVATVLFTMWLSKPPFYGAAIDIRYLPFGIQRFINTPGIATLLSLFPITFLATLLLKPNQRPSWFWVIGVLGFVLSIIAAIPLAQRSFFVVVLFISPLVVIIFLLLLRSWYALISVSTLFVIYPVLKIIDHAANTNIFYRPLDQNLFDDGRFQMFYYWFEHVTTNPFERIKVGPAPWVNMQWFHNFFADVHRLSGFWSLLTAIILMAYIFYRIFCVIRIEQRMGFFLMAIAIPCFLIMNTSVVPEGERQPFLLMLAIGAISEVILRRHKITSK
jgi:hypothetical protein